MYNHIVLLNVLHSNSLINGKWVLVFTHEKIENN